MADKELKNVNKVALWNDYSQSAVPEVRHLSPETFSCVFIDLNQKPDWLQFTLIQRQLLRSRCYHAD